MKARMSPLTTLFSNVLEVSPNAVIQGKEIKSIQIGEGEIKPPLFTEDIIMYVEYHKELANQTKNSMN